MSHVTAAYSRALDDCPRTIITPLLKIRAKAIKRKMSAPNQKTI
jgi:hypothetical protein